MNSKHFGKGLIATIFCLGMGAHSASADLWHRYGTSQDEAHWRSSDGEFAVIQVVTNEPQEFLKEWATHPDSFFVSTDNETEVNKPIYTFMVFTGCDHNWKGYCDVTVSYKTTGPDGEKFGTGEEWIEMDGWTKRGTPGRGRLQLLRGYMGVNVEDGDDLGEYTIHARIHDKNAGVVLNTSQKFVAKSPESL